MQPYPVRCEPGSMPKIFTPWKPRPRPEFWSLSSAWCYAGCRGRPCRISPNDLHSILRCMRSALRLAPNTLLRRLVILSAVTTLVIGFQQYDRTSRKLGRPAGRTRQRLRSLDDHDARLSS
jgi:hypothetical protein